jgi:hypothetical protein
MQACQHDSKQADVFVLKGSGAGETDRFLLQRTRVVRVTHRRTSYAVLLYSTDDERKSFIRLTCNVTFDENNWIDESTLKINLLDDKQLQTGSPRQDKSSGNLKFFSRGVPRAHCMFIGDTSAHISRASGRVITKQSVSPYQNMISDNLKTICSDLACDSAIRILEVFLRKGCFGKEWKGPTYITWHPAAEHRTCFALGHW